MYVLPSASSSSPSSFWLSLFLNFDTAWLQSCGSCVAAVIVDVRRQPGKVWIEWFGL